MAVGDPLTLEINLLNSMQIPQPECLSSAKKSQIAVVPWVFLHFFKFSGTVLLELEELEETFLFLPLMRGILQLGFFPTSEPTQNF
jgi:hypothetical protein